MAHVHVQYSLNSSYDTCFKRNAGVSAHSHFFVPFLLFLPWSSLLVKFWRSVGQFCTDFHGFCRSHRIRALGNLTDVNTSQMAHLRSLLLKSMFRFCRLIHYNSAHVSPIHLLEWHYLCIGFFHECLIPSRVVIWQYAQNHGEFNSIVLQISSQ